MNHARHRHAHTLCTVFFLPLGFSLALHVNVRCISSHANTHTQRGYIKEDCEYQTTTSTKSTKKQRERERERDFNDDDDDDDVITFLSPREEKTKQKQNKNSKEYLHPYTTERGEHGGYLSLVIYSYFHEPHSTLLSLLLLGALAGSRKRTRGGVPPPPLLSTLIAFLCCWILSKSSLSLLLDFE